MVNQTFKFIGGNNEDLGYISKDDNEKMILVLEGFWGSIHSTEMKLVNVDDFVGTIFFGKNNGSAIVECQSCSSTNLMVHFDGSRYANSVEISVYTPIIGKVFSITVDNVMDVTGKVML